MAEDIKGLIEKIQKEGVESAEIKAKEIEDLAKAQAASILTQAKQEAEKIIADAQEEARKTQASTDSALTQAARDMLISLRKEVNDMLSSLIVARVHQALKTGDLGKILLAAIKGHIGKSKEDIVISFSKNDAEKLDGLIGELKERLKQNIVVRFSQDIQAGFIISFDAGRSQFDFTEYALAEYIGAYLKPKLNAILLKAVS